MGNASTILDACWEANPDGIKERLSNATMNEPCWRLSGKRLNLARGSHISPRRSSTLSRRCPEFYQKCLDKNINPFPIFRVFPHSKPPTIIPVTPNHFKPPKIAHHPELPASTPTTPTTPQLFLQFQTIHTYSYHNYSYCTIK